MYDSVLIAFYTISTTMYVVITFPCAQSFHSFYLTIVTKFAHQDEKKINIHLLKAFLLRLNNVLLFSDI